MSRIYGRIFQIAYVVPDLDEAVEHWTRNMGVGPFYDFPIPLPFEELSVADKAAPLDEPIFGGVSISYSGDTMIELIQPGIAASTYRDFLESGKSGVHHYGTWIDDYKATLAQARADGVPVLLEGRLPLSRFAYLDTARDGLSPLVEVIAPLPPMVELFGMIKGEADRWDGSDPRRSI
ncbi:VOC family protein [Novosphingobium kaempferiae]|uniref:VOC family protein n=1 Tax=Novosphingobium kaempferiae TaxID=2896849 RepID=UPI001E3CFAD2|nr:VOC family protein [Novosphingobium kaempferiae]